MRTLVRQYKWSFLLATFAGIGLRLLFIFKFPNINGDTLIYAGIANNWLRHGSFALTESGVPVPTLIRLPGYPAFLAVIFLLFGGTNMTAVMIAQMFVDLGTCFVIAALALELFPASPGIARLAFVLAAICPFTANYVGLPLTETLAIFFTAFTLLVATKAMRRLEAGLPSAALWAGCGLSVAAGLLLRPDGGILLICIGLFLVWKLFTSPNRKQVLAAGIIVATLSLAPLVPWTIRNWRVFHVIQPLAPRYANAPTEYVANGFNRWVKTWLAEYVSVEDVFWKISTETPGEAVDVDSLPDRAFDSSEQRELTEEAIDEFNETLVLSPDTDAKFAELARQRIQHSRFRYYFWVPALRITDMWLRPRTEMLPIEPRWWTFEDPEESWIAIGFGALNLLLVAAGVFALAKFRNVRIHGLLLGFVVIRSLFLATIENPEPRYTLECFPVILAMAAATLQFVIEKIKGLREKAGRTTKADRSCGTVSGNALKADSPHLCSS